MTECKSQASHLRRETAPEQTGTVPHLSKDTPSFFHPFGAGSGEVSPEPI